MYTLDSGSFNYISGTVTTSNMSGQADSGVTVMVGIDGPSCSHVMIAGLYAIVTPDGTNYGAWYSFGTSDDLNITISTRDVIQLTLNALNETSGCVAVDNLSSGQMVRQDMKSSGPLCKRSAEWVIDRIPGTNSTWCPLPKFNVTFTDAVASGKNGQHYVPQGANITEFRDENGTVVPTSVTFGECSVTIEHV